MPDMFRLVFLGLAFLAAPAGAGEPMSAAQVAQALGFDDAAQQKLLAGEIVSVEREETTDKQLAVSIAMLVKGHPDALAAAVLDGQTLKANPGILGFGAIDPEAPEAGLAGVAYTADEADEVLRLRKTAAGDCVAWRFNTLSATSRSMRR